MGKGGRGKLRRGGGEDGRQGGPDIEGKKMVKV